ncbi:MAG: DUF1501 domain-containing protein [Planctomycetaceae bacterium]|nr:MAG: DUF1501 domain-containing protein [Planctomycetaceae bacterium]
MKCQYACQSTEHLASRRQFLQGLTAGSATLAAATGAGLGGVLTGTPAMADQLRSKQKRVLNIFLHGGVSQLESWDPKPGTDTGGPFRAIPTTVPGMHICELLPHTAKQMHHLSILRSLDTKNDDHGKGTEEMTTGHKRTPGTEYPHLGAITAKMLTPSDFALPGHILIRGAGPGGGRSAYLGPKYAGVTMNDGKPPQFTERPSALSPESDSRRNLLRSRFNDRFAGRRRTADTDAYTFSYDQAQDLLARREVFDVERESAEDRQRYGVSEFGQHCLMARRLLENDVPFVQVNHSNYDTHHENFDFHIEQLGEFDQPFAMLIDDLHQRGLLENTLVCVMSEFGRTPRINTRYGRDHWGKAWSIVLGGCGIQPGAIIGATNENGTAVADRPVDHGHVFHTILQAVGIDSTGEFDIAGRKYPIADPAKGAIDEILA